MKFPNFKNRPAHTLLLITEARTFRIDTDKTGIAMGDTEVVEVSCPTPLKLAECVIQVASAGRAFGKKTWLLYLRLPIAVLSMPTVQLAGLDEPSLIQALQFELEGLSGQSMENMKLAYRLLNYKDEMSTYSVCLINNLQFDDVNKAVKKGGSRLAGMLHPGMLPLSLADQGEADWLRIECWPNQLLAIRAFSDNSFNAQLFSFESRHWRNHLEQWLAEQGGIKQTETLLNNTLELLPETGYTLHLSSSDTVGSFLSLWAGVLLQKKPPVPVLRFESNLNQDLLLMVSGGAAALLICTGHLVWNLHQANRFNGEVEKLKKIETTMTAMRKSLIDDRDRYEKLKQKIDKLKGDSDTLPRMIKALQQRPARLLEAIARGRPENLLLEEINHEADAVKISGISLDSLSANVLAGYLEEKLTSLGWEIVAPTKKNMQILEGGGPWEFTITILDIGVDGFGR